MVFLVNDFRHVLAPLITSGKWEACVINSRGCAEHKITSGILFNARATWDVRQMVTWLRKMYPNRPLFGIGFSLGANILTNVSHFPVNQPDKAMNCKTLYLKVSI